MVHDTKTRLSGSMSGLDESLDDGNSLVDPMATVANIVDAMLVLAVGLMVAIVAYWQVDLNAVEKIAQQNEVTRVDDVERIVDEAQSENGYTELGKVYQDPTTGQMYMLTEDIEKASRK